MCPGIPKGHRLCPPTPALCSSAHRAASMGCALWGGLGDSTWCQQSNPVIQVQGTCPPHCPEVKYAHSGSKLFVGEHTCTPMCTTHMYTQPTHMTLMPTHKHIHEGARSWSHAQTYTYPKQTCMSMAKQSWEHRYSCTKHASYVHITRVYTSMYNCGCHKIEWNNQTHVKTCGPLCNKHANTCVSMHMCGHTTVFPHRSQAGRGF